MLGIIKKILGETDKTNHSPADRVKNAHIALCVLLLEAAHVDGECSTAEKDHVIATLETKCGIPHEEIEDLLTSGYRERQDSVDLFRFTRYMNTTFSKEEKLDVMDSVWRVILIDGHLEAHEDHFAHKLANLLRLTHKELIDSKIRARRQLS
ncbi:MAG: tellurite resistance TerB family protein [Desulforhopalus sp.]